LLFFSGCGDQDGIRAYVIPKPEDVARKNPPDPGSAPTRPSGAAPQIGSPEPVDRMIGAIIPRGSKMWFFKLTGPIPAVNEQFEKFATFMGTVKFGEGEQANPTWTLPAGWTEKPGNEMRFATIAIESPTPLELSISALPAGAGDPSDAILANINRWRGQMGLTATDKANLTSGNSRTEEVHQRTINGLPVTFINLVGEFSSGGMRGGPFSPGVVAGTGPNPPQTKTPVVELKYDVPQGWQPGKATFVSSVAFEVVDGSKRVEITATGLPPSGLLANVNRWRGQLQLEAWTEQQLESQVTKVPVGPLTGSFVELKGDEQSTPREAILAVTVEYGGRAWFFRLKGDAELAAREKDRFLEFVESVKFE
jgi:hypothetical protein